MSEQDRLRWDERWQSRSDVSFKPHPILHKLQELVSDDALVSPKGLALDMACGRGQNAIVLAGIGFHVIGVDISQVALDVASAEALQHGLSGQVRFELVDLDDFALQPNFYDLICVTRFLDRRLLSEIRTSLKPEGYVVYATRHLGALKVFPDAKIDYLLEKEELLDYFSGWQVLHYHEDTVEAELIARKPGPA